MARRALTAKMESIYDLTGVIEKQRNPLALFDIDGKCLYSNPTFNRFVGLSGNEVGCRFQSLIRDPDIAHEIRHRIKESQPWSGIAHVKNSEKDILAYLDISPMNEPCSQFFMILVPLTKIVNDQRAWEALHESEDNYQRLVNLSPNLIVICVHQKIQYINPGGLKDTWRHS